MKEILAKAGEIVVGDRNSIITAKALGSSLGICLYDSYDRCGGFVECLLPKCTKDERSCYVDVGIQQLYDQVTSISESHQPLIAKLIGGEQACFRERINSMKMISVIETSKWPMMY